MLKSDQETRTSGLGRLTSPPERSQGSWGDPACAQVTGPPGRRDQERNEEGNSPRGKDGAKGKQRCRLRTVPGSGQCLAQDGRAQLRTAVPGSGQCPAQDAVPSAPGRACPAPFKAKDLPYIDTWLLAQTDRDRSHSRSWEQTARCGGKSHGKGTLTGLPTPGG